MTFFQLQSPEGSICLKTKRRHTGWRALEIFL